MILNDLTDCAILSHGYLPYNRDYYFFIEIDNKDDLSGQYLITFSHSYDLRIKSILKSSIIKQSLDDLFTDFRNWQNSGEPEGHVWGCNFLVAYPGFSRVFPSDIALKWTNDLGIEMNELLVETNIYNISLIYNEFKLEKRNDDLGIISKISIPIKSK